MSKLSNDFFKPVIINNKFSFAESRFISSIAVKSINPVLFIAFCQCNFGVYEF